MHGVRGSTFLALTAAAELALYETALQDILTNGQSVSVNGRSMTRANLAEVRKRISELQAQVRGAARGPIRLGNARVSG